MTVFEIVYPGCRIELPDRIVAHTFERYLGAIGSRFCDAAVSLCLFEQAQLANSFDLRKRRENHAEGQPSPEEFGALVSEYGSDAQGLLIELERRAREARRKRWLGGELPHDYRSRLPFLHARMFVFSLWDIRMLLTRARECSGIGAEVNTAIDAFEASFPMLKGLRDSSAHLDERVAGRARRRRIAPQPVSNSCIQASGFMFVENLFGNRFAGTIETGELAEIEVSAATLKKVQECFQALLDSLPWSGPARHYPD
jgi:hypothetical protein